MKCLRCHQDNPPQAKFCFECGTPADGVASSHAALKAELEGLRSSLTEALEQQTATAEILRVISTSPTELQPVLDAVVKSAARFCGAQDAEIYHLDGEGLKVAAHHGHISAPVGRVVPVVRGTAAGRAVLERRPVHVADFLAEAEEFPVGNALAREFGYRTGLAVPLLRDGTAIGTINLRRTKMQPFADKEIALLQTFADQAVIAIENVRLFNETKEALEQQTATAEILRVIASSPTDLQPVMDAVAENATRVCGATDSSIFRLEGGQLRLVARHGLLRRALTIGDTFPVSRDTVSGRGVSDRRTIHVEDILAAEAEFPVTVSTNIRAGSLSRTMLATPLLREGTPLGAILIARGPEPHPFSAKQIALLETFANQAVIAIENVRLFTELKARNRELSEALERQTATGEVLGVIARTRDDVGPVFEMILNNAMRLAGSEFGGVYRLEDGLVHVVAMQTPPSPGMAEALARYYPRPLEAEGAVTRAIRQREIVHVADTEEESFGATPRELARVGRFRSLLTVPLLRDGIALGAIAVGYPKPGLLPEAQVAMVRTFADQAVIAIENVRLFTELEGKNLALTKAHAQVTEALDQQTATSDILRVISRSPTDTQPVFDAIVESAVRLCGARYGAVYSLDGELVHLVAHYNLSDAFLRDLRAEYPMRPTRTRLSGRVILSGSVAQTPDVTLDPDLVNAPAAAREGFRSLLGVPIIRSGVPIGTIVIYRPEAGSFPDKHIGLLKTFADQAVIAIENVRLFTELEARTADLTRSVAQLTALGEVGRAVSSTLDLDTVLDTIVTRANQLAGTDGCSIFEYDEAAEAFRLRASRFADPQEAVILDPIARATPIPKGQGLAGRAALRREPVHIPDIAVAGAYDSPMRAPFLQAGYRALLGVPLLHEERVIGVLAVSRKTPGDFASEVVDVLKTFATQSVLAVHNAHLFRELEAKSRLLEAASRHKSEFLANMSHELRTPLNAIIGFSEVLAERMFGEVNDKQAEYLQDILSSGRHLLSLINDILDLSKVEAGRLELELGRFHLPTALDNALTLVRERATRHGITLIQHVDERVGDIVADERKVKQILLNLLSNAVKFTSEGGRVGLTAMAGDDAITIAVSDTGVGIAPEDQAAIFEEFRQVGREDARKQEGTGLGLTLAKKFVELHGGRIWVESRVGQGSTFTFTLPVRLDEKCVRDQGGGEPPRP